MNSSHIAATGGLATQLDFNKKCSYRAVLGISLYNHYFTNKRVGEIANFGTKYFEKFTIILVDYPERWNWQLRVNATSPIQNEKNIEFTSHGKKNAYIRELRKFDLESSVKVLDWHFVMGLENYNRNVSILNEAFNNDKNFKLRLKKQFNDNIGNLLTNREELRGKAFSNIELNNMVNYLIEEIAGFFCVHFDEGYTIDFHHHPSMDIVQRIYNNEFPAITDAMGYDWKKQGWIQVTLDS